MDYQFKNIFAGCYLTIYLIVPNYRFGTVKSINIVKTTNSCATTEANEVKNTSASDDLGNLDFTNSSYTTERLGEAERVEKSEPLNAPNELENNRQTLEDRNGCDNSSGKSDPLSGSVEPKDIKEVKLVGGSLPDERNITRDEPPINGDDASVKDQEYPSGPAGEFNKQQNAADELKLEENSSKIASFADVDSDERKEEDSKGDKKDPISGDIERVFEAGCVYVEYRREEAACMAAHCLHGRTFDGRIVSVEYVGHDTYQTRFRG